MTVKVSNDDIDLLVIEGLGFFENLVPGGLYTDVTDRFPMLIDKISTSSFSVKEEVRKCNNVGFK